MGSLIISSLFMFIFFFFKEEEEEEEEKNRKLQLKNKPNDSNETTIKISACHAEVVWGRGGGGPDVFQFLWPISFLGPCPSGSRRVPRYYFLAG